MSGAKNNGLVVLGALAAIWIVMRKEFLEIIRDRKTLLFMIVLPVVAIPVLGNVTIDIMMSAAEEEASKTLEYAIFDDADAPEVASVFAAVPGFKVVELDSREEIKAAIAEDRLDFALVIPNVDRATEALDVQLHFDNATRGSGVKPRVGLVLGLLSQTVRDSKLEELGAATTQQQELLLEPVRMVERGTASDREVAGEVVGGVLPYVFIMFSLLGALYPAIDLGAGEKERGTLETLLLAPVRRQHIVLGKFFVILISGIVSATLVVITLTTWLSLKADSIDGGIGDMLSSIGVADMALAWLVVLPLTAVFSALLLAISIYAKSFKEAQSYSTPLQMFAMLPAMAAMLPGVELTWKTALIPVTNASLAIKEIVKGTIDPGLLAVIVGSSTLIAVVLLVFCTWWFSREEVLFRQ